MEGSPNRPFVNRQHRSAVVAAFLPQAADFPTKQPGFNWPAQRGWRKNLAGLVRLALLAGSVVLFASLLCRGEVPPDQVWREVNPAMPGISIPGRTGPSETYPFAATIGAGDVVEWIVDDPGGWSAVRLADGQTVWITTSQLKELTVPTSAPSGSSNQGGKPSRDPSSRRGNDATENTSTVEPASFLLPGMMGGAGQGDGWRPAGNASARSSVLSNPHAQPGGGSENRSLRSATAGGTSFDALGRVSVDARLDQIEAQFTRMLTQDPTTWDLKPLEDALAYLTTQPLSPSQVTRLKALAERTAEARQIAQAAKATLSSGVVSAGFPGMRSPTIPPTPDTSATVFSGPSTLTEIPPPATRVVIPAAPPTLATSFQTVAGPAVPRLPFAPESPPAAPEVAQASFVTQPLSHATNAIQPLTRHQAQVAPEMGQADRPIPTREEIARELNELRRQRFDAVGRLVRAQVRRPSDPPYQVINERGEIEAYLRPAPGTVLRTYVGHQVGVVGRKVRSADGRGPLLVAESVQLLDPPEKRRENSILAQRSAP